MGEGPRTRARVQEVEGDSRLVVLWLAVPGWAGARPGQFAMLQPVASRCFLPRAFSVFRETAEGSTPMVGFLVAPVGTGTEELAGMSVGEEVWVLGPLGRPFPQVPRGRLVVMGGGTGVAPFGLLLEELAGRREAAGAQAGEPSPSGVLMLQGFRDEDQAESAGWMEPLIDAAGRSGVDVESMIMTEDGSRGEKGLITDALGGKLEPEDTVFACGPHAMCGAVWGLARRTPGVAAWFSLESAMACGTGSCQGCVLPDAEGILFRVCRDGPVFRGEHIFGTGRGEHAVGDREGGRCESL